MNFMEVSKYDFFRRDHWVPGHYLCYQELSDVDGMYLCTYMEGKRYGDGNTYTVTYDDVFADNWEGFDILPVEKESVYVDSGVVYKGKVLYKKVEL